jgi:hypothetical protein
VFVKPLFYTRVTDSVTGQRTGSPFGVDGCRSLLYVDVVAVYRRHWLRLLVWFGQVNLGRHWVPQMMFSAASAVEHDSFSVKCWRLNWRWRKRWNENVNDTRCFLILGLFFWIFHLFHSVSFLTRPIYLHIKLHLVSLTVTNAFSDPSPGWIDSFNCPFGAGVLSAKGLLQSFPGKANAVMDIIRFDIVMKIMCAAARERAVCA